MHNDPIVLRAMLRHARRRVAADQGQILVRTCGTAADVRAALRRLERSGLVVRTSDVTAHLTLAGLAVAVASTRSPALSNTRAPSRGAAFSRAAARRSPQLPARRRAA